MTSWQGARESATEWLTGHWLELATVAALAYSGVTRYLKLPLLLLLIASALSVVLIAIAVIVSIIEHRDRRRGISHGLEHATIALLERVGVPVHSGSSTVDGFIVRIARGSIHQLWRERVQDAAERAIGHLAAGERQLAYTPDCGTSWLVERAMFCICAFVFGAFAYFVGAPPHVSVLALATAVWFARAFGHIVGIAMQHCLTVDTSGASVRIVDVQVGEGKGEDNGTFEFRVGLEIVPRESATR